MIAFMMSRNIICTFTMSFAHEASFRLTYKICLSCLLLMGSHLIGLRMTASAAGMVLGAPCEGEIAFKCCHIKIANMSYLT